MSEDLLKKKTGELWIESSKVGRKCGNLHVSLASLQQLSAENCDLPGFHIEKAKYLRQKVIITFWFSVKTSKDFRKIQLVKNIKYRNIKCFDILNISLNSFFVLKAQVLL